MTGLCLNACFEKGAQEREILVEAIFHFGLTLSVKHITTIVCDNKIGFVIK